MNQINKADSCCNISLFSQFLYFLITTAMIILKENEKNVVHRCWNSKYLNSLNFSINLRVRIPQFNFSSEQFLSATSLNSKIFCFQHWCIYKFFCLPFHCRFLVPENSTKILTDIWHQFWYKNEKGRHWNYSFFVKTGVKCP